MCALASPFAPVSTLVIHRTMLHSILSCPKGSYCFLVRVRIMKEIVQLYLSRNNRTPSNSVASIIEYEWFSDIPFLSLGGPSYLGYNQLDHKPVPQPKRNSLLTFISSSFQKRSLSKILLDRISIVTPPVRSSIASLDTIC